MRGDIELMGGSPLGKTVKPNAQVHTFVPTFIRESPPLPLILFYDMIKVLEHVYTLISLEYYPVEKQTDNIGSHSHC